MRKYLIVALVVAAGCDATRRDFDVCSPEYAECSKGFTCNTTTWLCEPTSDAGPAVDMGQPDQPLPTDTAPADVALDATDTAAIDVIPVDVQAVDGGAVDVPSGEAGGLYTSVPDAPGTCTVDRDCPSTLLPYCVSYRCVACRTSNECSNLAGTPFCSAANTCVSCAAAPAAAGVCSGATPVCDSGSGRCVECTRNSECPTPGKAFCVANQCVGCQAPGASASDPTGATDGGASDGGGAIDAGVAGPCSGAKPVCAETGSLAGQCVECASSTDCSGSKPICSANLCTPCTTDQQCADKGGGPGVCMSHQDSRCASEAETIYVQNSTGCSGGAGTVLSPYCRPQDGVNAVTTSKRVVVLTGGTALSEFIVTRSDSPLVSVIGRQNPMIGAGAANKGIHVQRGNVYLRGLRIEGAGTSAAEPGIVVESGATITMDRCYVMKNAGGLLVKDGAGFDIANSVFAKNESGNVGAAVFGGVYLGVAGVSLPHRFWFNTIAENGQFAIGCASSTQQLSGMLFYNNAGGDVSNCTLEVGSWTQTSAPNLLPKGFGTIVGNPRFSSDETYHLTQQSTSPCRDFVASTAEHPPFDIDGDPRPYPGTGKLDCGADEYVP